MQPRVRWGLVMRRPLMVVAESTENYQLRLVPRAPGLLNDVEAGTYLGMSRALVAHGQTPLPRAEQALEELRWELAHRAVEASNMDRISEREEAREQQYAAYGAAIEFLVDANLRERQYAAYGAAIGFLLDANLARWRSARSAQASPQGFNARSRSWPPEK